MQRFLTVFILLAAWSTTALAENQTGKVDASIARLGTLSTEERKVLAPHLAQGPVILTEFQNRQTDLPAVIYAARIHAPAIAGRTAASRISNMTAARLIHRPPPPKFDNLG